MGWLTPDVLHIGEGGLLVAVFLAMLTGQIVPKSLAIKLADQANKNAEMQKQIADTERARADLAVKQSGEMIAGLGTLERLVRSQTVSAKETP